MGLYQLTPETSKVQVLELLTLGQCRLDLPHTPEFASLDATKELLTTQSVYFNALDPTVVESHLFPVVVVHLQDQVLEGIWHLTQLNYRVLLQLELMLRSQGVSARDHQVIRGLREDLEGLETANDLSMLKIQDLREMNQVWKQNTRKATMHRIDQITQSYENVLDYSYRQLMEVKNSIHLAYHQMATNISGVIEEIDRINSILGGSNLVQAINMVDPPFKRTFQLVQRSEHQSSVSGKTGTTFFKTREGSQQQLGDSYYEILVAKLKDDYRNLAEEYYQLVHRIVNFEENTIVNEILTQQKVKQLWHTYRVNMERSQQQKLRKGLRQRKESLAKISSIILNDLAGNEENYSHDQASLNLEVDRKVELQKIRQILCRD